MNYREDLRMSVRSVIGRPAESLLLSLGVALAVGATAAGIALAGRTSEQSRELLSSPRYREIVVAAREDADEMDLPAQIQTSTEVVMLTAADLEARSVTQAIQYAYLANRTGFRFGESGFGRGGGTQTQGQGQGAQAQGTQTQAQGTQPRQQGQAGQGGQFQRAQGGQSQGGQGAQAGRAGQTPGRSRRPVPATTGTGATGRDAGPRSAGPRSAGPRSAGPRPASPRPASPRPTSPRPAGGRTEQRKSGLGARRGTRGSPATDRARRGSGGHPRVLRRLELRGGRRRRVPDGRPGAG